MNPATKRCAQSGPRRGCSTAASSELSLWPSLDGILDLIRQRERVLRDLRAVRLGIFGSFALGEAHQGSDLDVRAPDRVRESNTSDRTISLSDAVEFYASRESGLSVEAVQIVRVARPPAESGAVELTACPLAAASIAARA